MCAHVPECQSNCYNEGEACDPNAEVTTASAASACPSWCTMDDTDGMCRGVPACQPCPVCDEVLEAMAQEGALGSYAGDGGGSTYSYNGGSDASGGQDPGW